MSNPIVFFDITAGGSSVGRIEMTVSAATGYDRLPYHTELYSSGVA